MNLIAHTYHFAIRTQYEHNLGHTFRKYFGYSISDVEFKPQAWCTALMFINVINSRYLAREKPENVRYLLWDSNVLVRRLPSYVFYFRFLEKLNDFYT